MIPQDLGIVPFFRRPCPHHRYPIAKAAFAAGVKFILFEEGYGAGECVAEMVHARFSSFDILPALVARGGSGSSLELELEAL